MGFGLGYSAPHNSAKVKNPGFDGDTLCKVECFPWSQECLLLLQEQKPGFATFAPGLVMEL